LSSTLFHHFDLGLVSSLTKSHLVPHSDPGFFQSLSRLFVFLVELDNFQKSHTKSPYGRWVILYLWLTTLCDTFPFFGRQLFSGTV